LHGNRLLGHRGLCGNSAFGMTDRSFLFRRVFCVVAMLVLGGCEDQPTEAQRHRDNLKCAEFAAGVPAETSEAAYKRCMEGGPRRFKPPEDGGQGN
jgi:hypothetical protein